MSTLDNPKDGSNFDGLKRSETANGRSDLPSDILHVITRIADGGSERRLTDAMSVATVDHRVVAGVFEQSNQHPMPEPTLVPDLVRSPHPVKDIRAVASLRRVISRQSPDIVHTHQSKAAILTRMAVRTLPRHTRPKLVHSLSMANFGKGYNPVSSFIFRTLERLTSNSVDKFFAVGEDLGSTWVNLGVPSDRVATVRSSLDLSEFTRLAHQRSFTDRPVKLLFVGALSERKGVQFLADAYDLVNREHPARLSIVGKGELADMLESEAAAPGRDWDVLGFRSDVARLMSEADLLLLPSQAEGLPQVLVQAAANGLPSVCFDFHGTEELKALGADCSVADSRTAEGLGAAILRRLSTGPTAPNVIDLTAWDSGYVRDQIASEYEELMVRHAA